MRKFAMFLILMGMTLNTYALGLSHIQVYSKLNEPLNAKINILSIPKGKANTIKVSLASGRAFRRAGLERPFILTKINFKVQNIGKTSSVINVATQQVVKEPFLNFLVEVSWPGGRILREYTVLLDPPLYKPASAKKLITRGSLAVKLPKYPPVQVTNKPNKKPSKKRFKKRFKKRLSKKRVTRKSTRGGSYTVFKNDTLSQIAQRTRPNNISLSKQMRKIYQANPRAFINGNKNMIKSGKVLKIPDWNGKLTQKEVDQIAQNSQRDTKMTTKNTPKAPESSLVKKSISAKKIITSSPRLVLSTPKSKSDKNGTETKEFKKLRQEVITLTEKNSSIESENKALKEDITATKSLVSNMKQQLDEMNNMLLAFKSEGFAKLQSQLAKQAKENKRLKEQMVKLKAVPKEIDSDKKLTFKPTARLPSLGENTENSSEIEIDKVLSKPSDNIELEGVAENSEIKTFSSELDSSKTIVNQETIESGKTIRVRDSELEEPDFMASADELVKNIPGGWLTIIAILGGIILLILIIIIAKKPKSNEPAEWKKIKLSDEEIEEELTRLEEEGRTSSISEPNILDDIKQTTDGEDTETKFEVDPKFDSELREEVDQYMVAEKYALAEDLVESAIKKYPHHHKYRLELLEIHAAAKELDKFEKQAQILHDEVDGKGPLWDETLELWNYLSPNKELSIDNSDNDNVKMAVAGAAGLAVGAGVAAVALSGDDELDLSDEDSEFDITSDIDGEEALDLGDEDSEFDITSDIDGEEALDLGDDLSLNLDDSEEELDLSSGDEELDLGDEIHLDEEDSIELDSDDGLDLGDDDELDMSFEDLDNEDSSEELSLEDDDLSLDSLDDSEELSLEDDDLSLDGLDDSEELSLEDDDLSLDNLDDSEELSLEDDDLSLDNLDDSEELSLEDDDLSLDNLDDSEELSLEDDDLSLDNLDDSEELSLEDDDLSLDDSEELSLEDDDLSLDNLDDSEELSLEDDDLSLDDSEELSLEDDDLSLDSLDDSEELSLEDDDLSLDSLDDSEELSLEDDDLSLDSLDDSEELSLEDDDLSLDSLDDSEELSLEDDDLSLDSLDDSEELSLEDDDLSLDSLDDSEELSLDDDDLSLDDLGDNEDSSDLSLEDDEDLDLSMLGLDDEDVVIEDLGDDDDLDDLLNQLDTSETSDDVKDENDEDEISSQFDLAQMFIDMDDNDTARGILDEIIQNGNEEQQQKAQAMITNI